MSFAEWKERTSSVFGKTQDQRKAENAALIKKASETPAKVLDKPEKKPEPKPAPQPQPARESRSTVQQIRDDRQATKNAMKEAGIE